VRLLKIGWVGTRTENPEAMADFCERVLGLRSSHSGDGVWVFQLPDGSKVEVFTLGERALHHGPGCGVPHPRRRSRHGGPSGGGSAHRLGTALLGRRGGCRVGAFPCPRRQHLWHYTGPRSRTGAVASSSRSACVVDYPGLLGRRRRWQILQTVDRLCSFAIRDPRKAMGAGMNVEPGSPWPTTRFPLRL
jgi:hypothetical protein